METVSFAIGRATHPAPPGARHLRVPLRLVQRSWATLKWPRAETLVGGADLVHALDLVPPPSRVPVVLTVHDVTPLDHPEFHPARRTSQQRAQLDALDRVAVVLADSHATASRLVQRGLDERRVAVVHLGVTPLPPPAPLALPVPYLLLVGAITRRKGYDVLLRAFARANLPSVRLVFAGPDDFDAGFCRPLAAKLGLGERALFLGPVDDATLAALYQGAVAVCFPSLAEGFGLPVLEALAQGSPVVASNLDAVREIAGDAALLVPAGDEDSWQDALGRIVGDDASRGPGRSAPLPSRGTPRLRPRSRPTSGRWPRRAHECPARQSRL